MRIKPKAIVTDLDGVIRFFPVQRDQEIEKLCALPRETIARIAFEPSLLLQVTTGKISDMAWRDQIIYRLKAEFPIANAELAVRLWSDFHGDVHLETLNILRAYARTVPLSLLTNATDRLEQDLKTLGINDCFANIFNSSVIGFTKPSTEIFTFLLDRLNLEPCEIVFIDDSLANVNAAEQMGFATIHFVGPEALNSGMKKLSFG